MKEQDPADEQHKFKEGGQSGPHEEAMGKSERRSQAGRRAGPP